VTFAPESAVGVIDGHSVFTHGVEIGFARNETHDLRTATEELIDSLHRGNPDLRAPAGYDSARVGNREGLHAELSNRSEATGQPEIIDLFTTRLRDGNLFYLIGVAPRDDFRDYQPAFRRAVDSLQIRD
jgi:hypothetical protein